MEDRQAVTCKCLREVAWLIDFLGQYTFPKRHSNLVVWIHTTDAHEWLAPADDIWSSFGLQAKIQTLDFYRLNWPSLPVERVWIVLKDNFPWAFKFSWWMWISHMITFWQKMILLCWIRQHSTISLHRTLALESWPQSQVRIITSKLRWRSWFQCQDKPGVLWYQSFASPCHHHPHVLQSKFWIEFCQMFRRYKWS